MSAPGRETTRPLTPHHLGWMVALVVAWGAWSLWLVSDGAVAVAPDMLVLYVGAALMGVTMLAWLVAGSIPRKGVPAETRRRWPYFVGALLVVAAVPSLCRYGTPFQVRLGRSKAALQEVALRTPRGFRSDAPRWVGLLRVQRIDTAGTATRFFTGPCDLGDLCGVTYGPDGAPAPVGRDRYVPLGGPWWSMAQGR
jgi:hypothetical protein